MYRYFTVPMQYMECFQMNIVVRVRVRIGGLGLG